MSRIVMQGNMVDISRIIKLLNLTSSRYDGECLNAIRKANILLMEENKTWADVFQTKQSLSSPINTTSFSEEHIRHMLTMCIVRTKSKSGLEFLKSLQNFYRNRGMLTARQLEALQNWYKNI